MKLLVLLTSIFWIGCGTTGTAYKKAEFFGKDGYFVTDSKNHPGHGVSVFQAVKGTKPVLAVAYTILAAHEHCIKQNKVSAVLPPQYFKDEGRFASSYQCSEKIKIIKGLPRQLQEMEEGIVVLDEFTELPFMEKDLLMNLKITGLYHKANSSKTNRLKLKVKRDGKERNIIVKLIDKTEDYRKSRKKDIDFLCKTIREEKVNVKSKFYPEICRTKNYSMTKVYFKNKDINLGGELYKPEGKGPFPAVLYNHGSAPGMLNSDISKVLGPMFAKSGWVFFMPYRRGQGLSANSGPYIMDLINAKMKKDGLDAAAGLLVQLHKEDHLHDQLAALNWLRNQTFIYEEKVAAMGNSFGGIQTMLGISKATYCAGVNGSGASKSWKKSTKVQQLMSSAAKEAKAPVFFFQAQNDYTTAPSKELAKVMTDSNQKAVVKIYPAHGKTKAEGHSFTYKSIDKWALDAFNFLKQSCS